MPFKVTSWDNSNPEIFPDFGVAMEAAIQRCRSEGAVTKLIEEATGLVATVSCSDEAAAKLSKAVFLDQIDPEDVV